MAFLFNDPAEFTDELIEGFTAAFGDWVMPVPGGVIRATEYPKGEVAVVIGGGSGHYPAFAGLVGPGFAHGAAMGNVFASPSAQQVYEVAKAAENGGGVFFSYGNYAGDVLNFDQAQERLRAEGIACETVTVTDDIASAGPDQAETRRGIAGDLFVFKIAAAAAEAGMNLEQVTATAQRANAVTRTLGVAFSGCTLPGASEPLFTVPKGMMAVGMGIHGEPGIEEMPIPSAHGLANFLAERVLAERPEGAGNRVVVLVNGLGSVKSEELFILYRSVVPALEAAGLEIVGREVGELATSFEMAGLSLTLSWVDDELLTLWDAPASTPAYRKGGQVLGQRREATAIVDDAAHQAAEASPESRAQAPNVAQLFAKIEELIDAKAAYLGELDATAGDGDHGIGMQRGAHAAAAAAQKAAEQNLGAGSVIDAAGEAWADRAGGTSGAIWGIFLRTIAAELGNESAANINAFSGAVRAGVSAVQKFGKAELGDKTMMDALIPYADELENANQRGEDCAQALASAAAVAEEKAQATADLLPRKGRAKTHGEKSRGVADPGAVSFSYIARLVSEYFATESGD